MKFTQAGHHKLWQEVVFLFSFKGVTFSNVEMPLPILEIYAVVSLFSVQKNRLKLLSLIYCNSTTMSYTSSYENQVINTWHMRSWTNLLFAGMLMYWQKPHVWRMLATFACRWARSCLFISSTISSALLRSTHPINNRGLKSSDKDVVSASELSLAYFLQNRFFITVLNTATERLLLWSSQDTRPHHKLTVYTPKRAGRQPDEESQTLCW